MENRSSIYAEVIELLGDFIYEYYPSMDEICFYVISNGKEVLARRVTAFSEWKNVFPDKHIEVDQREAFVRMCDDMIAGKIVKTSFRTDFFNECEGVFETYNIVGKKHIGHDGIETYIGGITTVDQTSLELGRRALGVELVMDAGVDVYNKKSILEYCRHFIEENPDKRFYIAILDLDNFKNVNDTFGHFFGDDVLITVSEVIKEAVKDYGMVGRVGGDEFFIVFDKVDDREAMRLILKNAREQVEKAFKGKTGDFALTCSAGSCPYPDCGSNFEEIYKVADALLYLAKEKGRNRYILFREDLHRDLVNRVIQASKEGKVAEVYDDVSVKYNHVSIMESVISDYYIGGKMSLDELLENIENRFNVDFIQIISDKKGIENERRFFSEVEGDKVIERLDLNEEFVREFKGLNYFRANSLTNFKNSDSNGKEFMRKNKVQTAIFYLIRENDEIVGYIVFGKVRDNRKFAEQDCIVLTSIMQFISLKI